MSETNAYFIYGVMILSLVLHLWQQRSASPLVAIFSRWMRWALFSLAFGWAAIELEWSDRPFWVLVGIAAVLWFIVATGYNWMMIHAINSSPLALFPRFSINGGGDEWPTLPRLLRVRDWLRKEGFRQQQALRAEVGGGIYLRVSVYQNEASTMRVQVTFLPQPGGNVTVCYTIITETEGGRRYVTDNLFLPFGGFYPENWHVARHPWRRDVRALYALHQKRLKKMGEVPVAFSREPLIDINQQQHELDQLNTELGFLLPHAEREEHGKISSEGRYRIWKEVLTLNYFGRSQRYE